MKNLLDLPGLDEMRRLNEASQLIISAKCIENMPPETLPNGEHVVSVLRREAFELIETRPSSRRGGQEKFNYVVAAGAYLYLTTEATPRRRHTHAINEIAEHAGVEPKTMKRALGMLGITSAKQIIDDAHFRRRWLHAIFLLVDSVEKLEPSARHLKSSTATMRGRE